MRAGFTLGRKFVDVVPFPNFCLAGHKVTVRCRLIIEAQCCTVCTLFLSASDATKLGPDLIANHDMRGCRVAVVPIGADLFAQKGVLRTSVF